MAVYLSCLAVFKLCDQITNSGWPINIINLIPCIYVYLPHYSNNTEWFGLPMKRKNNFFIVVPCILITLKFLFFTNKCTFYWAYKLLKFTLKYLISAPTCFGPLGPSSGSSTLHGTQYTHHNLKHMLPQHCITYNDVSLMIISTNV